MGSAFSGFTNRDYTFLLSTILCSIVSGTSGSYPYTTIYPGAAWAAMPPHQDGLLPGLVEGATAISSQLPAPSWELFSLARQPVFLYDPTGPQQSSQHAS